MWQKCCEAISSLSPAEVLEYINSMRSDIERKLEKGEEITDEDIEFLNKSMEEEMTKILDKFKKQALATTRIERTDTHEEMKLKIEIQKGLLDWLSELFDWVVQKIKEIFERIKDAVEFCFQKAKELFEYLWSFFK